MHIKTFNKIIFSILVFTTFIFITPRKVTAENHSVEITKHLGSKLPLDLKFKDSNGDNVILKNIIEKPTVIDFVYYKCAGICTPLMIEVSNVVQEVGYKPGQDYEIISISINPEETPEIAAGKKKTILEFSKKNIPDSSWYFLTGDSSSIYKLAETAGFGYIKTDDGFLHKGVLIVVDKIGRIVQYLSPGYVKETGNFQILPAEFDLAIDKATNGEITPTIAKVLQTCFNFIPHGRTVMILLLIFASSIVIIISVIVIIKKSKVSSNYYRET